MTFHDEFAAGASWYGISDLELFATGDTHKFESRYEHTLVGPWPEAADLYRARSPIHSVDLPSAPMLLPQGAEDEVVPPSQAEIMVQALRAKAPVYLLFVRANSTGFRRSESIEAAFLCRALVLRPDPGFEPAGDVPRLAIENPHERSSG